MSVMQASHNPFNLPNRGGPGPSSTPLSPYQQSAQRYQQATGQGGGPQTPLDLIQATGGQGMQMAQNPVMAPPPPQITPPQMPQAVGLDALMAAMPQYSPLGQYGASAWQMPQTAAPGPPAASQGPQGASMAPGPPQISTGITVPPQGQPPQAPQMPTPPSWAGAGGAADAYSQAVQPMVAQQAQQYYQQMAPMQLAAQQAQSGAGLDWGGLWQQLQQAQQMNQLNRLGGLMPMLG